MKKLLTLICALTFAGTIAAQTINVQCGQVTEVFKATADEMPFCCGTRVTIQGRDYPVSDITKIYFDESEVPVNTVTVVYNGNSATVRIPGDIAEQLSVTVNDAYVKIEQNSALDVEMTYILSGSSTNGSFVMDGEYKATVKLNGLTLSSDTTAAINIHNGKRINVIVADGTVNTLADGAGGLQKACFFINGHAEFSGNGTLNLTGNAKHAYRSDEYSLFEETFGGTFNVLSAASDAMHVEQYIDVRGGTFVLKGMKGDGIDVPFTNDPTDVNNGYAFISGGTFNIDCTTDDTKGIKCDTMMTITGGNITVNVAGDGCKGISSGGDLTMSGGTISMTVSGTTYHKGQIDESKCRGIKVNKDFTFTGGTIGMSVTDNKAKGIKVDGTYYYNGSGTMLNNLTVDTDGGSVRIN